ncbi:hypothetical protein ACEN9J_35315 [Variovorax sp. Varisp41]|jgi:hypothetical protein|uniref:hypothetical protein n=1 Tax=unclassified Variovorax TaxID=663243 RepID=UPI000C36D610|nr:MULTISPECIES: hypothetical protein [unclassified Variovorax]MBS75290.1 hypothetical protein [Variovorax sp.]MCT8173846.1 hypothetical protein [Variovorax sp. CY25R-8]
MHPILPARRSRRGVARFATALGLALLLAACGGGGGGGGGVGLPVVPPAPAPAEGSATLGAEGGVVEGPDGVRVTVPPGALRERVTLRIARDGSGAPGVPAEAQRLSAVYAFTPHGQQFDLPVEIRLPIDASGLPADRSPPVLLSQPGEPWIGLPVDEVKRDGNAVRFLSTHFSWGLAACEYKCTDGQPWFGGALLGSYTLLPAQAVPGQPQYKLIDQAGTRIARLQVNAIAYQPGTNRIWCEGPITLRLMRHDGRGTRSFIASRVLAGPGSVDVPVAFDHGFNGTGGLYVDWSCTHRSGYPPNVAFVYDGWPHPFGVAAVTVAIPVPVAAPVITRQPADATAGAGQAASFSVAATAPDSLFVQWQRSDDAGASWRNVGTGTSFSVANVQAADHGALIRARVCNARGLTLNCIDSDVVRLDYTGPIAPAIVQAPHDLSVVAGQTASFTVTASGRPAPTLAWFRVEASGDQQVGTGATYTTPATQLSDDGARFYAVATNSGGRAVSSEAVLRVASAAQAPTVGAISATPGLSIVACASVTLSATASGTAPLQHRWRRNGTPLADGAQAASCNGTPATVSGAGSATLVLGNVPAAWSGSSLDLAVSNSAGNANAAAVTLTVIAPPSGQGWSPGATIRAPFDAAPWNYGDAALQGYGNGDAWALLSDGGRNVWATRYRAASGAWDPAEPIAAVAEAAQAAPVGIATDDQGRAVAVWVEIINGMPRLWMRHHGGTAWSAARRLDDGADLGESVRMGLFPWQQARVQRSGGQALIAWSSTHDSLGSTVRVRRLRLSDGLLEAASTLGSSIASLERDTYRMPLQLAVNSRGDAMAFWHHLDGTVRAARYALSTEQWTLWSGPGPNAADYPAFALDGTGRAWQAVPVDSNSQGQEIDVYSLGPADTRWTPHGFVTAGRLGAYVAPKLVADDAGNAILAWPCGTCVGANLPMNNAPIHGSRFSAATQAWSAPQQLDPRAAGSNGFVDMSSFDLRMNARGDALLTWAYTENVLGNGTGVGLRIHARQFRHDTLAWGAVTQIAASNVGEHFAPIAWLAPDSPRAMLLWSHAPGAQGTQAGWSVYLP